MRAIIALLLTPMDTDLSLLEAARKMDKEAIVKIFDRYATPLYNYARRLCGDPLAADHIVGDVFARLMEQLAAGNGPRFNLRSYLYETTYHIVIDEARSSNRRLPLDILGAVKPDVLAGRLSMEDQIMFQKVMDAVRKDLSDDQRHVIILRFLEGFNMRETATILGKDENQIKVIQSRALAKLRKVFESSELRAAVSLPRISELSKHLRI